MDEVYSNLIHWRRQGAEAQGTVEHGEVHGDLSELPRWFLFHLHDLALLVHNHLLLGRGITKLYRHIFYTLRITVLPHTKEGSSLSFLDKFAPMHE